MQVLFFDQNTPEQAQGFIAAQQALRLDTDIWPIQVDVYFDQDPDPSQIDEFAVTNTLAGDHYELRFRNDAPHFQNGPAAGHFDRARFYAETVAHELGHVFTFALNDEALALVAKLFNTEPTDEAMFPASKVWADRPGEAIAETFKDAFMGQRHREWPNRTNIQLRYPYLPLFRAIYRNAVTEDMLRDAEDMAGVPEGSFGSVPPGTIGSGGVASFTYGDSSHPGGLGPPLDGFIHKMADREEVFMHLPAHRPGMGIWLYIDESDRWVQKRNPDNPGFQAFWQNTVSTFPFFVSIDDPSEADPWAVFVQYWTGSGVGIFTCDVVEPPEGGVVELGTQAMAAGEVGTGMFSNGQRRSRRTVSGSNREAPLPTVTGPSRLVASRLPV